MYRTCLFCNADLGANEVIEAFPVGRRLAFDGAKGRLWVVCRRCERWNLTPLEERWEAIEACERAFRGTRLRVSTDNIGLARVAEGLELVRIGSALRPEMAAWRYGDQFGRRQRRFIAMTAAGVAVGAAAVAFGPWSTIFSLSAGGLINLGNAVRGARRMWNRTKIGEVRLSSGEVLKLTRLMAETAQLRADREHGWALRLEETTRKHERSGLAGLASVKGGRGARRWEEPDEDLRSIRVVGPDALRVATRVLPRINKGGAGRRTVRDSVQLLEEAREPERLFAQLASTALRASQGSVIDRPAGAIAGLPRPQRLALEMAVHEDVERRALEGELQLLEAAWREAEEVAKIADDLFIPDSVTARLERLRRRE